MSASKGVLLFSLGLIIILTTVTFVAPYWIGSQSIEGKVASDFRTDMVDHQTLVKRAQNASTSLFYENLGQVDNAEVRFYGRIPGGAIGFAESKVYLCIDGAESRIALLFDGAFPVIPQGIDEINHHTNYFLGDRGTFTGIKGFTRVVYNDLWSGISLFYEATADGAKYEFHVAPGADPTNIRVRCNGSDSVVIGKTSLRIENDNRTLVDDGLKSFQGTTVVESEFISLGHNVFGFNVGDYDRSRPLVIDPLLYSTYVGGSSGDCGNGIAVDSTGNAYITGYTYSIDFPTVNAHNTTLGWSDCFVFKLSSAGDALLYSTYVGGSSGDCGNGIAVDSAGNAYVTGYTLSADFPTVNAYDSTFNGGYVTGDCFVLKLPSAGDTLLYSTYVGGNDTDFGGQIAVDSTGFAYVTGHTASTDFPTVNATDNTFGGDYDCFVFKLSSDGDTLLYSTYVGGSDNDFGKGIAVDSAGNAYVTGMTGSTLFPTVNAYDSTFNGRYYDCFVFKLSSAGNTLLYSTYVGGSSDEFAYGIAVDSTGNAYVTGDTVSADFPTVNAYDNLAHVTSLDCFVFKLSSAGDTLLYSTFVGGRGSDEARGIAVDSAGCTYVAGYTDSVDFPTVNATDSTLSGSSDCFVFKLSYAGDTLLYSTYVGGSGRDSGNGITVDSTGSAYVTGDTWSADFPTVNATDSTLSGLSDCSVFKLTSTTTDNRGVLFTVIVAAGSGLGLAAFAVVLMAVILKRSQGNREPGA